MCKKAKGWHGKSLFATDVSWTGTIFLPTDNYRLFLKVRIKVKYKEKNEHW